MSTKNVAAKKVASRRTKVVVENVKSSPITVNHPEVITLTGVVVNVRESMKQSKPLFDLLQKYGKFDTIVCLKKDDLPEEGASLSIKIEKRVAGITQYIDSDGVVQIHQGDGYYLLESVKLPFNLLTKIEESL